MDEDFWSGLFIGLAIGTFAVVFAMGLIGIDISQDTGDDICRQLTGDELAIAQDNWDTQDASNGKLVCVLSSYDSTQNIVIKENLQGGND